VRENSLARRRHDPELRGFTRYCPPRPVVGLQRAGYSHSPSIVHYTKARRVKELSGDNGSWKLRRTPWSCCPWRIDDEQVLGCIDG
jgi:hypothetical protein